MSELKLPPPDRIPLFPLEVVLFPNLPLPLHIFEDRYKLMIGECLETGQDFGVVLITDGKLKRVGTTAKIENVLERYHDGRLNLLCLGKKRFSIEEVYEERPFLEARINSFDDEEENPSTLEEMKTTARILLDEYGILTGRRSQSVLFENYSPATYSFLVAELNFYTLKDQQRMLEMRSAIHRFEKGLTSLRLLNDRLRLNARLQELLGKEHDFLSICN